MNQFRAPMALVLACTLLGACATQSDGHSAYNNGVAAYRSKDFATARVQWSKSVDSGDTSAMNNLGYLLSRGLGGERDEAAAIKLWTTAATRGHPEAAFHLGWAYKDGIGVAQSDVQAYAWFMCSVASSRSSGPDEELNAEILKDANDALSHLMTTFPPERFSEAQDLARRYVQEYAGK